MHKCFKDVAINCMRMIPDERYLKIIYRIKTKKKLNLVTPKSFNEKIQWLKIYNRKPEYIKMVDKYEAKKYVAELIGEQYVIPTLGVWDDFEDIDFGMLPNQFVLKCTHDSGSVVICKDKSKLDISETRKRINKSLKQNYYWKGREWVYKAIPPRIIAEEYMEDEKTGELRDYKFLTFNGVAKMVFMVSERQISKKYDFFDMDFKHMDMMNGSQNARNKLDKPESFEEMRELAEILARGIPHVRVDFYEVNGKVYFGEVTFYHQNGLISFEPDVWDDILGDLIELPE